jgi:D-sedoheptulose 7-phosphate isomerase
MNPIEQILQESIQVKQNLFSVSPLIQIIIDKLISAYENNHKLILCGNGGSAADAQHVAAELVGRFLIERQSLPAIALTTNTSTLTALGNDYDYSIIFARQIEAFANPGDVIALLSTSGNSKNIIKAAHTSKEKGCFTIGFTGEGGGDLKNQVDLCLCIPSTSTPRIQEAHITIWHIICELVESAMVDVRRK